MVAAGATQAVEEKVESSGAIGGVYAVSQPGCCWAPCASSNSAWICPPSEESLLSGRRGSSGPSPGRRALRAPRPGTPVNNSGSSMTHLRRVIDFRQSNSGFGFAAHERGACLLRQGTLATTATSHEPYCPYLRSGNAAVGTRSH